jgi:hypothetical protein
MSSSPPNNPYDDSGRYSSDRRRSFQPSPSPGSQQRSAESPVSVAWRQIWLADILTRETPQALPDATRVNQGLVDGYDLTYRPHSSIDTSIDYYAGNPGNYGTAQQYQGLHSPAYPHHTQSAAPIPYASSQSVSHTHSFDLPVCSTFRLLDTRRLSAARNHTAVDSGTAPPQCRVSPVCFVASAP